MQAQLLWFSASYDPNFDASRPRLLLPLQTEAIDTIPPVSTEHYPLDSQQASLPPV